MTGISNLLLPKLTFMPSMTIIFKCKLLIKMLSVQILPKVYSRKSKTQTVLFEKQAATLSPSRFQQTSKMPPLPRYVLTRLPSLTDQMCRHLSNDPLARYSPVGLKATEYTGSLHWHQIMTIVNKSVNFTVKINWESKTSWPSLKLKTWNFRWSGRSIPHPCYLCCVRLYSCTPCSASQSLIVASKEALQGCIFQILNNRV